MSAVTVLVHDADEVIGMDAPVLFVCHANMKKTSFLISCKVQHGIRKEADG